MTTEELAEATGYNDYMVDCAQALETYLGIDTSIAHLNWGATLQRIWAAYRNQAPYCSDHYD